MSSPLYQLIVIRFKEFIREPGIIFWSLIFPVLTAWVLGIGFSKRGELIQNVALIENNGIHNVQLRDFLTNAEKEYNDRHNLVAYKKTLQNDKLGKTTYKFIISTPGEAILMIKKGISSISLREENDSLYYQFDPKNPEAKLSYILLSSAIRHEDFVHETANIKPLETVGTRYIDFLIPGLIALDIMNSFLWGISYALIEMRAKKLLRRMMATPMRKFDFIFSHFVARVSLAIIEALILFVFAKYYFHITVQGSKLALVLVFLAGNVCFTGLGVLLASRTANLRIGNGLMNVVTLPMTILSGIFFSYHNFPALAVKIIQKLPLTVLADNLRSIFIEGAGLNDVFPGIAILTLSGLLFFAIGIRIYKWY